MSRPVSRSTRCDAAHITGANPMMRARVSRRLSEIPAMMPSASASTSVVRTNTVLMTLLLIAVHDARRNLRQIHESQTQFRRPHILLTTRDATEGAEEREFPRPLAVQLEGFQPQRLRLLVRAISGTGRAGFVSSAAAMHDHRVVPHGKTVCQVQRFARPDSGRD